MHLVETLLRPTLDKQPAGPGILPWVEQLKVQQWQKVHMNSARHVSQNAPEKLQDTFSTSRVYVGGFTAQNFFHVSTSLP